MRWWKRLKDIYHQAAPSAVDYRRPASELQAGVASGGGGKSLGQFRFLALGAIVPLASFELSSPFEYEVP